MPNTSNEITPHSFSELHYVTTNPDSDTEATLLDTNLDKWIDRIALPSVTIGRFATFNVLEGLATVEGADVAIRSERYGLSGVTYIDGVVCDPSKAEVLEALASVSMGGKLYETDTHFVEQHLARLRQQPLERVVVGRFGDSLHAFDPSKDSVIQSRFR